MTGEMYYAGGLQTMAPYLMLLFFCPQWDLQLVLDGLAGLPFGPLDQAYLEALSLKTACVLAVTSAHLYSYV